MYAFFNVFSFMPEKHLAIKCIANHGAQFANNGLCNQVFAQNP